MNYNTRTLTNSLRVIHLPSASPVVYCGYEINAGTEDEAHGDEGLAHFCEHVTFKGTRRRNALDIINTLESVGGELNAFTTKTDTVYYAAIMKEHVGRAVDVLSDIVFNSIYPQKEIDKEVEVICDEIESYNDSPAELIYDEFENIIFGGTPLGHNILGTADRVRAFSHDDAVRFTHRLYRPDNSVFFAYGDIDFDHLVRLLEAAANTGYMPNGNATASPEASSGSSDNDTATPDDEATAAVTRQPSPIIVDKQTHQAHVMLGAKAYGIHDERRMALYLLNNILGGPGMNARLNLSLREKYGLVYTVESTMVSYANTGIFSVYFGCDSHDIDTCIDLVRAEFAHFIEHKLTDDELSAARQQIKGQIGIACDNRENFALDFGKSFLHYGWEKDVTTLFRCIDAITADQIQQVARDIFSPERLTTLIFR